MKLRAGTIEQVDSNSTKLQTVQVTGIAGEVSASVDYFTPYGFNNVPVSIDAQTGQGAETILAEVFGTGNTTVIAATDRRFRPTQSNPGDVMLFAAHDTPGNSHDNATQRLVFTDDGNTSGYRFLLKLAGCTIQLSSDGSITISNGSGTYAIDASGNINLTAPTITINGNTTFNGTVKANGHSIDETHTHKNVTAGTANTGVVN